eukprot:CAMPEP_0167761210 /NCGR_PEP_ID=MMETSP0110_2-20121227/12042_1 /TAXON_ID=629695 /ORGANISM="Gymnochlora sp., Strain CCMP2014" /LENGTH=87 /DNA_ID=CAMNT_0007647861 /DNA_START=82 /DNA_END=342 /DNA_ORIENTATION=+
MKTKTEFNEMLEKAGDKLVVVDFTATWCGPCQKIAPFFEELQTKYPNAVFVKVDVDENAETSEQCGITAMPTFQFFKKGEKVGQTMG